MNKNMMNNIGLLGIIVLMITMLIACDSESGGGETPPVGISNLYAWGSNEQGQLGNGNKNDQTSPIAIGTKTWKQVSAGNLHTMAIDSAGKLYAWGENASGQLGNGENGIGSLNTTPVAIEPTKTWQLVSAGGSHTMAIDSDGSLYAWGKNGSGQLGNNSTTDSSIPVAIKPTKTWKLVIPGTKFTMAIDNTDKLYAWGNNGSGQLGNNSTTDSSVPVAIEPTKTWKLVSTGGTFDNIASPVSYTMAIDTDNHLFAWGNNSDGQLGITTINSEGNEVPIGNTLTPSQVGTKTWKLVSANNGGYTMAIDTDGKLYAWGRNNVGQLGNGDTDNQNAPVPIEPTKTWTLVSTRGGHTMAIDSADKLYTWGDNTNGQLGIEDTDRQTTPVAIEPTKTWSQVSAGNKHTLGIIQESVSDIP